MSTEREALKVPLERRVMPLRCAEADGGIYMGIGMEVLCFSAEQHPDFYDPERCDEEPCIRITDRAKFLREIVAEINSEAEDGSTLLTRMLDEAIRNAVESGCEGVDHEA